MIKVRPKEEREILHKFGCTDEPPCECLVKKTPIHTGKELYEAIKNPEPSHIIHDADRNKFRNDKISEIFIY